MNMVKNISCIVALVLELTLVEAAANCFLQVFCFRFSGLLLLQAFSSFFYTNLLQNFFCYLEENLL
jgi:hypothetical protein